MSYSSRIFDFLGEGLAANRPATLNISPVVLGIYYATDTKVLSLWNGLGWDSDPSVQEWTAGIVSDVGSGLVLNEGTISISGLTYDELPAEVQSLPLGFIIPGKPAAGQVYHLVMATAVTIPANLAGTVVYDGTLATANAVWTLNKISAGASSLIGTVTITSSSHTGCTLSTQAAVSLAIGDVVQLVAPTAQDTTLADIGITILAAKV